MRIDPSKVLSLVTLWIGTLMATFGLAQAEASRWGNGYIPDLPVITQDGKTLHFYSDLIKDKIFVLNFFYASCRDICPLTTARLSELQEKLGDSVGRDVFIYTLSIDPENDTPDRLKQYAEAMGAKPGWFFLTGLPEDIRAIGDRLGERSRSLSDHRNEILLGNGATGEWQRESLLGDIGRLAATVRSLDPNWRMPSASIAHGTGTGHMMAMPSGTTGMHAMYAKLCAGCHTVGQGDRVGPDLKGVTERRSHDWLLRFIANPEKMRQAKDPIAIALSAKYPAVRMPFLGVVERDAADLIAYLEKLDDSGAPRERLESLLALTTQNGTHLTREDLDGHPVAVAFGFTGCPDVCPTTLLEWSNVLAGLGPDADRLRVLFVSVDPDRDTPETLKAFMSSFDPRIVALTGSAAEIAAVAKAFDAYYEKVPQQGGGFTFDHTTKTYLLGSHGRFNGSVDPQTPDGDRNRVLHSFLARP